MPNESYITGLRVVKNGKKSQCLNLSNARIKTYAQIQEMTEEELAGVIICPDYPLDEGEFLPASRVLYDQETTVEDKIDELDAEIGDLSDLETTDKSSVVNAINEIASSGGATITSYTLTLNSGITGITATAIKFGKLVILNIQGSISSVIANSATICSGDNFPAALAPENNLGWTYCGTMCTAAPSSANMTYVPCAITITSTGFAMANDYGGSMYAPRATLIYVAAN